MPRTSNEWYVTSGPQTAAPERSLNVITDNGPAPKRARKPKPAAAPEPEPDNQAVRDRARQLPPPPEPPPDSAVAALEQTIRRYGATWTIRAFLAALRNWSRTATAAELPDVAEYQREAAIRKVIA